MVAVQVGNKNMADFAGADAGVQNLMLGGLAAVKQPHARAFRTQIQRRGRHIALRGGRACARTEKVQVHKTIG